MGVKIRNPSGSLLISIRGRTEVDFQGCSSSTEDCALTGIQYIPCGGRKYAAFDHSLTDFIKTLHKRKILLIIFFVQDFFLFLALGFSGIFWISPMELDWIHFTKIFP
jgi:hypothetical protein